MNPRFLGRKHPFVIAEIGGNHEGDFDYACRLLDLAAQSGADAVKFQTYKADKIVSPVEGQARNKHFKKFELTEEQFESLAERAEKQGVLFMSSFWDIDAVRHFDRLVQVHKVGSGDITNFPILEELANKNKPLILSTAMSNIAEVQDAVAFINSVNPKLSESAKLALLHCVAMYGEPRDEYANLRAIRHLQNTFPHLPIGYSDHSEGMYACEIAVGMDASIIEKHFTDDKSREFRDHHISATKQEMQEFISRSEKIVELLGDYQKRPVSIIETEERIDEFRRAIYLVRDLPAGTVLTVEHLTTLRPNKGISANKFYDVVGKKLVTPKKAYQAIFEDELE